MVVDQRADVFTLGSILATILTGQPAFVGHSKWEILDKSAWVDLELAPNQKIALCPGYGTMSVHRLCLTAYPLGLE